MKILIMVEEGSVSRVRNAIARLTEISKQNELNRRASAEKDLGLDDAVQQLISAVREFAVVSRSHTLEGCCINDVHMV